MIGTTSEHGSNGTFQHRVEHLKAGVEGYVGKLENRIKAHPIAAIGIAFGIGYIFTRIVRRG